MTRLLLLLLVLWAVPAEAQVKCSYYVDPDWKGLATGGASSPWISLDSGAWTTINAALAASDVTVCFSAREAFSDTNETTTTQLGLMRTNASSHRLTLMGNGVYNANDSAPSWVVYLGSSKFQITATAPITTGNYGGAEANAERNFITVHGFKLNSTGDQGAYLAEVHDFVFEQNWVGFTQGSSGSGPGILVAHVVGSSAAWPARVVIRENIVYRSRGEGIYVGGRYNFPGEGAYNANPGPACDDILIQGNTVTDPGYYQQEGDGIDVKDGNTNVRIVGNVVSTTLDTGSYDVNGIVVMSADLIESNFITGFKSGVTTHGTYDTTYGRDRLVIRNNVIANNVYGMKLYGGRSGYHWSNTRVFNNTVYGGALGALGIYSPTDATSIHANITLTNNLVAGTSGVPIWFQAGQLTSHSNNLAYNAGGVLVYIGTAGYDGATLTKWEPTAQSGNPAFVGTAAPYAASAFRVQSGSPAIRNGVDLSAATGPNPATGFVSDFNGAVRPAWDIGAIAYGVPSPPARVVVR